MVLRHTGQDFPLNVILKPQSGGAINVADIQGVLIYLIHEKGKILKRYSVNQIPEFGSISLEQSADDVLCEVKVDRSESINADLGIYHLEVKIQTEDDSFTLDQLHTIAIVEEVFMLEKAHSRSQNPS